MTSGPPYDPDEPVSGCYRVRLVRGGPFCGVRLFFGPPLDPETREELDRSPRWLACVNGQYVDDAFRFWPSCGRDPISYAEYLHYCRRARTMDSSDPYFDPTTPVDVSKAKAPF